MGKPARVAKCPSHAFGRPGVARTTPRVMRKQSAGGGWGAGVRAAAQHRSGQVRQGGGGGGGEKGERLEAVDRAAR